MLAELPWTSTDGGPSRSAMWYSVGPTAADGWAEPRVAAGQDVNKVYDEATAAWLKEHAGTFRLKRFPAE